MKIAFFIPSLESVYAGRFVYEGYKNAALDLGYKFFTCTSKDNLDSFLKKNQPDIFIYSLNFYHLKFLDLNILKKYRDMGMVVFCQIRSWQDLTKELGCDALKNDKYQIELISSGMAGDIFWHWFEQDEPLMKGFTRRTGKTFETILLAADKTIYYPEFDEKINVDVNYVGSYIPAKREFLDANIKPLSSKYKLKIYGSDWSLSNRALGKIQKAGQYFNINFLKSVRKINLSLEDERKLYSSAKISLNVHEDHVRIKNCEINERTFKILACGGFEICDNVRLVRKYFNESEMIIADGGKDWFSKIDYYINHVDERSKISRRGMKKVLSHHTYHNRVEQIKTIYEKFKKQ